MTVAHEKKEYRVDDDSMLENLQRQTFAYFRHECDPQTGLIADKTADGCPASISATGFALGVYAVGVERGWMDREEAVHRTRRLLRFLWRAEQSKNPRATGYNGFFYHFLDMRTGRRFENCELSTIDTACLVCGALTAEQYYERDTEEEAEIRDLARRIHRRVNWRWALNGGATVSHGWTPEKGFITSRWDGGYSEALKLYILALGSPTYPLAPPSYDAFVSHYGWRNVYGVDHIHADPLFTHQYPHVWIDFRAIQDNYTRQRGIDYFENSRRATHLQQQYAIDNPHDFAGYGDYFWGLTASDGPGPLTTMVRGKEREFYAYCARGVPDGPDDGTIAPWAVACSLPFAPQMVLDTMNYLNSLNIKDSNPYGYKATINCEFPNDEPEQPWVSEHHYGINQGPLVLMIENYRTGLIWRLTRRSKALRRGLHRAGFSGGWL